MRLCCRASVSQSGKGTLDVASGAPTDEGRSCHCRPFDISCLKTPPAKKTPCAMTPFSGPDSQRWWSLGGMCNLEHMRESCWISLRWLRAALCCCLCHIGLLSSSNLSFATLTIGTFRIAHHTLFYSLRIHVMHTFYSGAFYFM